MNVTELHIAVQEARGVAAKASALKAWLESLPDAMKRHAPYPCEQCGHPILQFRGRHSNKVLLRHEPGGCSQEGKWL